MLKRELKKLQMFLKILQKRQQTLIHIRFRMNERKRENYNEAGGKEPMNPEDIASHEPTAVKRDKKQGTSGDPV